MESATDLDGNGDPAMESVNHPDQFSYVISDVTSEYQLSDAISTLKSNREFGMSLIDTFAIENVAMGVNDEQSDLVLSALASVLMALSNGYLETAIRRVKDLNPATFDGVFLSEARLLGYVNRIEIHLGITLSTSL